MSGRFRYRTKLRVAVGGGAAVTLSAPIVGRYGVAGVAIALERCTVQNATHFNGDVHVTRSAREERVFPDRVSETLGVCLLTGGSHQCVFDGRTIDVPSDSVFLRRPGAIWSSPRNTFGFVCIDIARDLLPRDVRWNEDTWVPQSALPPVVDIAEQLLVEEDELAQEERVVKLIDTVTALGFASRSEADSERVHAAAIARDYLETCYASNVSLDDLAFLAGTNRFSLIRMFRRTYGLTPHAFQIRLRVEHACRLLRAGIPVHEVAPIVGFSDQSHLTRHFARVVGLTPARYARTARTPSYMR